MAGTAQRAKWRIRLNPETLNRMAAAIGPAAYDKRTGLPRQSILVGDKRTGVGHTLLSDKHEPSLDTFLLVGQCYGDALGIEDPKEALSGAWDIELIPASSTA